MIDKARATGLYAELEVDDMLNGIAGKPDASAELILAADAMVYIADLAPVLAEARRVLVAGGVFAFTTETHDGEGVILGEGLRYAHSAAHVRATVAAAGLTLALLDDLSARNEDNIPAPGLSQLPSSRDVLDLLPCGRRWRGCNPRRMRGLYPRRQTPHPASMLSHRSHPLPQGERVHVHASRSRT